MSKIHSSGTVSVSHKFSGTISTSKKAMAKRKTVYPTFEDKLYKPDANYDYISEVEVKSIPIQEVTNERGGITLIIGKRKEDNE